MTRLLGITSRPDPSALSLETTTEENEGTTQDSKGQGNGQSIYEKDMLKVKSLLRMFPMWGAYVVVAVVSATGSTYFIEQYSNLNASKKLPVQIYTLIQQVSTFAIPFLYRCASCSSKNEKVKIGVGMLFSVICCISAWQLEVHRLKAVKHLVDPDANTSISFGWLIPQFIVLGCMEGLTKEGLLNFFKAQVNDKGLESYGEEYIEVVLGLGKVTTIILILILKSQVGWFTYTINESRLDKYYKFLVCACAVNFTYYCVIATCFFKDARKCEESANNGSQNATSKKAFNHQICNVFRRILCLRHV